MERLWTGARWTEGPAWFPAHNTVVWSDIPNDRMMRYDALSGHVGIFRQPARNSNGNTVDREGRLVTCEHGGRRVSRTEHDGSIVTIADRWQGKRLNSPNDVVVRSDGSIWFTDPAYGIETDYEGDKAESEIGACHVYRVDPDGSVEAVVTDMVRPNGLAFSLDEKQLYVVDTGRTHGPQHPAHMRVFDVDDGGFAIRVAQSFGNCPQYIRKREITSQRHEAPPLAEWPRPSLDDDARWQIASADTFFIATHYAGDGATERSAGTDVSHRGGKPGFVRVDGANTLTWPDFRGNAYYNTLGNLYANPRAGLLFVDFASGDFLHVAGDAEILWQDEMQSGFEGAQRLVRLHVREVRRVQRALPAAWCDGETSPTLERTGAWPTA